MVFGPIAPGTLDLATDADVTVNGIAAFDASGYGVGSADLNDDGKDDLIIGAPNAGVGGQTYVIFGPLTAGTYELSSEPTITFNGAGPYESSGSSVGAGDLNNDGIADLLIGAPSATAEGRSGAGETYVLFGPLSGGTFNVSTTADVVVNGVDSYDNSGFDVAVGDINDDGADDLIIGAYAGDTDACPNTYCNNGEAYVVFGPLQQGSLNLSDVADITAFGIDPSDYAGFAVGSGDVNNDGSDDLIIGAPYGDPGVGNEGETYVVFGPLGPGTVRLSERADRTYAGIDVGDASGYGVASGDLNDDGSEDLIIGAATADPPGTSNAGETYVIFGAPPPKDIVQVTTEEGSHDAPAMVEDLTPGRLIAVYESSGDDNAFGLYMKLGEDGGDFWSQPTLVFEGGSQPDLARSNPMLWLVFAQFDESTGTDDIYYSTSTAGGSGWSTPTAVVAGPDQFFNPTVTVTDTGRVIIAWQKETGSGPVVEYVYSDDDGATWTGPAPLDFASEFSGAYEPDLAGTTGGTTWIAFSGYHQPSDTFGVHFQSSTDNGATWSAPGLVDKDGNSSSMASTTAGLVISWIRDDCTSGEEIDFCDRNIVFRTNTSTDATASWSATTVFTAYKGDDRAPQVAAHEAGGFGVAWTSERRRSSPWTQEPTIWFGSPNLPGDAAPHVDAAPPPAVVFLEHFPIPSPKVGDAVTVGARVEGDLAAKPELLWRRNGLPQPEIVMRDETLEVFTAQLGSFDLAGTRVEYEVRVVDVNGNEMTSFTKTFRVLPEFVKRNNVLLVLDNPDQSQVLQVFPYVRDALDANGIGFDVWNTARFGPPFLPDLVQYKDSVVIWSISHFETWLLDHPEREIVLADLATFLSEGGSLFLTGQQIGERLWYGSGTDRVWMRLNLHATLVTESQSGPVFGIGGDPVGGNFTDGFEITGGDGINDYSPDEVSPRFDALAAFDYATPTDAVSAAGIRHESQSNSSKLLYLAFNFESINNSTTRASLMGDALAWINPTCNGLPSTIDGTPGADVIFGTEGDDVILGLGGLDQILAYGGNDTICGGSTSDLIHGGDGNDWINGLEGVDFINGGAGQDVIYGGQNIDLILGGAGDDLIEAGPGNDNAAGGAGDDVVYGGDGDDSLLGGDGDDVIFGELGDDTIKCEAGSDVAVGGGNTGIGDTADLSCEVQFQIEN